jgi:hypothetical protein
LHRRRNGLAGFGPIFVGSPSTVADLLQEWVEDIDVDGFNLAYAVTPETVEGAVNPRASRRRNTGGALCAKSLSTGVQGWRCRIPARAIATSVAFGRPGPRTDTRPAQAFRERIEPPDLPICSA